MIFKVMYLFCLLFGAASRKLCYDRVQYDARWEYIGQNESSNPEERCPTVSSDNNFESYVQAQFKKYQCSNYRTATNVPFGCEIRELRTSLRILQELYLNGTVLYIGDSLSVQQYIAALCDMEHAGLNDIISKLKWKTEPSIFLRQSLPCSEMCQTNATYRGKEKNKFETGHRIIYRCEGCPDGVAMDNIVPDPSGNGKYVTLAQRWWDQTIPADARVVILNTGAWYSFANGVNRPVREYQKTINELVPVLTQAVKSGIIVAWIPIPLPTPGRKSSPLYNRHLFAVMNYKAKDYLSRIGVIYIDSVQQIAVLRKAVDPVMTIDDLHWCNLAPSSITSYINQVYFHFISLQAQHIQEHSTGIVPLKTSHIAASEKRGKARLHAKSISALHRSSSSARIPPTEV